MSEINDENMDVSSPQLNGGSSQNGATSTPDAVDAIAPDDVTVTAADAVAVTAPDAVTVAVPAPVVAPAAPVVVAAPISAASIPMPFLQQAGEVYVGPGALKEAQLIGLGLTKLRTKEKDKLYDAKRYAMDLSIKQIMLRQQQTHQQNQQRQQMYGQALSLMARVYIGSISFEVREENIKKAFEPFGPIKSINMSWDAATGHHKGFAFLEYEVPEAAVLAQEAMNGVLMGGRNLKVGRPSNMPQAQPIIEMVQQEAKKYHRVYVASVHPDLSEQDVRSVFEAFGEVTKCQLARQSATGKGSHRGFGYLEFNNTNSMSEAIAGMNMFDLGGQYLRVGRCITPPEALSYIVPQAQSALPQSAAVALAQITAKVQAIEATSGGSGGTSPGQASPARQASPAPVSAPSTPTPTQEASSTPPVQPPAPVAAAPTAPAAIPPPPSVAMPPVPPPPPSFGVGLVPPPPSSFVPPPPQIVPPPPSFSQLAAPSAPAPAAEPLPPPPPAAIPPPSVVNIPPPGVVHLPPPSIVNPVVKPATAASTAASTASSLIDRIKLNKIKKRTEDSMAGPASFAPIDEKYRPRDQLAEKKEEEGEGGQKAIGGGGGGKEDIHSMALALLEGSGPLALTKSGQSGAQGADQHQKKKRKIKPPKVKGPQLTTEAALAAAEKAGQMSDALMEKEMNSEEATLASQEGVEIRGNESRHLLMTKLMRINRSHVLLLKNMVSAADIDDMLEGEIKEECEKYGTVDEVLIVNDEANDVVKIFVKFVDPTQVDRAKEALNGRFFAGKTISAVIYDQPMYDHGDYSG